MKRIIAASLALAALALCLPAPANAQLFGRRRGPVQRNLSFGIGGGRGLQFNRSVVRGAAPVVVQPGFQIQRQVVVQQVAPVYAPAQVQQFQTQQFRAVGGY